MFKYDRDVVNGLENREIPDLWGRVDRYVSTKGLRFCFLFASFRDRFYCKRGVLLKREFVPVGANSFLKELNTIYM